MKHSVHVHNEGDAGLAAGGDSTLVTNVQTHSSACAYEVDEMTAGELMYCDRDYVFLNVPDFLDGVDFIRTANGDKRSDSTDEQFLCFVLTQPSTVYGACCATACDSIIHHWQ